MTETAVQVLKDHIQWLNQIVLKEPNQRTNLESLIMVTIAAQQALLMKKSDAYDAGDNGTPKLLISTLNWDANGWPKY